MMTLDQLQIFVNIVKKGSLHGAAKALHRTQPTLSTSIKNLEAELGMNLLDRSGYRVKPSEAGQLFFEKAQQILLSVDELYALTQTIALGREVRLRLVIDYLCPRNRLFTLLREFHKTCPETKLDLAFEVLDGAMEKLLAGEADLAITPNVTQQQQALEICRVSEVTLVPVVSGKLAKKSKSFAELVRHTPQIYVKDTAKNPKNVFYGSHPDSERWLVNDHLIKKEMILSGLAWGHLEKHSIRTELANGTLAVVRTKGLRETRMPLYLVRTTTNRFGPVARSLWETIQAEF